MRRPRNWNATPSTCGHAALDPITRGPQAPSTIWPVSWHARVAATKLLRFSASPWNTDCSPRQLWALNPIPTSSLCTVILASMPSSPALKSTPPRKNRKHNIERGCSLSAANGFVFLETGIKRSWQPVLSA